MRDQIEPVAVRPIARDGPQASGEERTGPRPSRPELSIAPADAAVGEGGRDGGRVDRSCVVVGSAPGPLCEHAGVCPRFAVCPRSAAVVWWEAHRELCASLSSAAGKAAVVRQSPAPVPLGVGSASPRQSGVDPARGQPSGGGGRGRPGAQDGGNEDHDWKASGGAALARQIDASSTSGPFTHATDAWSTVKQRGRPTQVATHMLQRVPR